jgi:hypothetical protein
METISELPFRLIPLAGGDHVSWATSETDGCGGDGQC